MGSINLANSKNRDAVVKTQAVRAPRRVRWLDEKGRQAQHVRLLRATADRECDMLLKTAGSLENVSKMLLDGDPEIDMETFGRQLTGTSKVFIDPDKKVVRKVQVWDIVRNPDGTERERRPQKTLLPNIAAEIPLRMSGKLMKKSEFFNKFVVGIKQQIVHVNGLTYDFLFNIAKELHDSASVMMIGSGPKGSQPIVIHRGGTQYRGFLEGRIQGEKYCLILHLSNMELKAPPAQVAPEGGTSASPPQAQTPIEPKAVEPPPPAPPTPAPAVAAKTDPVKEPVPEKPKDAKKPAKPRKKA